MIVVSGLLVLVALVFLVIGVLGSGLGFIWASIITSVVSGVFLLLGALQRRGGVSTAAESGTAGTDMLERVTAVSVRPRDAEEAAEAAGEPASSGAPMVSVVPGRPRYHVASCRFLAGRPDVEQIALDMAQGEGYTACGVCKPDQAIAAEAAASAEDVAEEPVAEETAAELDETAVLAETASPGRARKAPAKKAAAATKSTATKATATKATAAKATKAAAKPAARGGSVVVIPDRPKFHVESCRFVKDVPGTVTLTKSAATRQGYTACGVCKP